MAQFKSIEARRVHTFGHGIRAQYPEPVEHDLVCTAGQFIKSPPRPDPAWQVAALNRFIRFSEKYAVIDARFGGWLAWRVQPTPVRYLIGPVEDAFCKLAVQYLDAMGNPGPLALPTVGQFLGYGPAPGVTGIVESNTPDYTLEDMKTQLYANAASTTGWVNDAEDGLCNCMFSHPDSVAKVAYTDGSFGQIKTPAVNYYLNSDAWRADLRGGVYNLAILLILWGHCQGPQAIGGEAAQLVIQPAGFANAAWLDWIETCAGRVLWQMAHVETLLMLVDLFNTGTGGRGGLVQHGSGQFVGKLTPPTTPPVKTTWQQVAPYVDKVLSAGLTAVGEALLTAL